MRFVVSIVLLLLTANSLFATDKKTEAIQKLLNDWHKSASFSGATLGVTRADGSSFGLAVGHSDREAKTPMKPTDMMLAGSVGKTFVSVIAMNLVAEGKLDVNAKMSKYLGDKKWFNRLPNAQDVTIRHLLTHTSGLVRYEFNPKFTADLKKDPYKVWTPEEQISYLFDSKANFKAGEGWEYSDTNFIMIGMIIEKITGKKYNDLAAKLLKKHGLKRSMVQDGPVLKGLIPGYAGPGNPFGTADRVVVDGKFVFNPAFEWTGGGIVSNSIDLSLWAKAIYEGKTFDKSLLDEYLKGVPAKLGRDAKYGYGVIIRPTRAGLTYGHSGFFPGYLTDVMYFPKEKIALAIQVNSSDFKSVKRNPAGILIAAKEILTGK